MSQIARDGETKTGAPSFPGPSSVGAVETPEDMGQVLGSYAGTAVPNGSLDLVAG
jgi:hypothetical protein